MTSSQIEQTKSQILERFPQARQEFNDENAMEASNKFLIMKIPYEGFSYSATFHFMQILIDNNQIEDFNLSESSLEQIFLQFSSMQHVLDENKNFKEPDHCCFWEC